MMRCQQRVLQRLISAWPRRGHTLLDVGCGTGLFLEMLWDHGFDVTGLDPSPASLEMCRQRLGCRAELRLGALDHLPFDDGTVDYLSVLNPLAHVEQPDALLAEAFRVARLGIVMGFMNTWSIQGVARRLPLPGRRRKEDLHPQRNFSPWQLYRRIRCLCPHARVHVRSILPGPAFTWKDGCLCGRLNQWMFPLPLGAYVGLCINVQDCTPLTPIHLTTRDRSLCLSPFAQ